MSEEKALTTHESEVNKALAAMGGFDAIAAEAEASDAAAEAELSSEGAGGVDYVTFKRHGEEGELSPWEFGLESNQIHPDSEWVVDVSTFMHGYFGYEGSYEGRKSKGRKPDKVLTPWNQRFPEIPADRPWCNKKAFQFRAVCRSSPIEDHVGVMVENCDYRRMKTGYADLERACRLRLRQAKAAKERGDLDEFKALAMNMNPVIQFRFELGVDTGGNGLHNRGVIKHIGWASPVVNIERDDDETEEENLGEELAAKAATTTTRRRRRE